MKIKKILKIAGIGIIAIVVVSSLGLFAWSKIGTMDSKETAEAALKSTESVIITTDQWIVFEPVAETNVGLIFYPGGLVDPKAYSPILHDIAEEGILVIITPMPLNLAIFNTNAANSVIEFYPQITNWIIAGHSLGGASVAIYAENNSEKIHAITLWDSYPPDSSDLSDNAIAALSIFGTMNNFPNTENFNDKKHLMPPDTVYIGIEGANHAQFGDYGLQKGDVIASMSMVKQHLRVAEIMLDFISDLQLVQFP